MYNYKVMSDELLNIPLLLEEVFKLRSPTLVSGCLPAGHILS